jgi:heme-degrading monooxygenase HmoA
VAPRVDVVSSSEDLMITFINVFEIEPEQVETFLAGWRERAEFMSRQPGFRSFRLHRALAPDSRFQLINVAEWDSAETLQSASSQPEFVDSARRSLAECRVTAHPGLFRVAIETAAQYG